jgi:DNA (cytosine-5)-methyltransferase 1
MPGFIGSWETCGTCRSEKWPFYGANQNCKGDAICRPMQRKNRSVYSAKIHGLGERPRSVQQQQRRRLPGRPRRNSAHRRQNAVVPQPPNGKWTTSGAIMGDGWSIAWRVLDAQFWGVPQRRRRISLVADFGGQSAPEILFERKGLCWDSAESGETGEGIAADAERSAGKTGGGNDVTSTLYAAYGTKWNGNAGAYNGDNFVLESTEYAAYPAIARSPTARNDGSPCIDRGPDVVMQLYEPKSAFEENWAEADVKNALRAEASKSSHAIVFDARDNGDGSIATYSFQRTDELKESQVASTQSARQYKSPTDLVAAVDCRNGTVVGALCARDYKGVGSQYVDEGKCIPSVRSVRRLTPLECERLQGFPDGWTNIGSWTDTAGKLHKESSDSARYKALGNSIALPPWKWVLKRLCACYERDATMASLFDGIGGFPLIWEQLNGKGMPPLRLKPQRNGLWSLKRRRDGYRAVRGCRMM